MRDGLIMYFLSLLVFDGVSSSYYTEVTQVNPGLVREDLVLGN